jgi:hypothetical protein
VYTHGNLPYDEFFTCAAHYWHRSNIDLSKTQEQQLEALRVEYGIKRIVTWHLELLISQMDALIDVCNVRIAMLIACNDEPLTITWGNLHVGEIGNEEKTFQNNLQERQLGSNKVCDHVQPCQELFQTQSSSAGRPVLFLFLRLVSLSGLSTVDGCLSCVQKLWRPLSFWGCFFVRLEYC